MPPFSRPVSGLPEKHRVNEFLADLTELAVKHFPGRIDRTRISEEDGYMIVTLKNGKAGSVLEMAARTDGIGFAFASVRWHVGSGSGMEGLFARASGELLGILSGEKVMARISEGGACRGFLCPAAEEVAAVEAMRKAAPPGEPVFLKSWDQAERRASGEGA